MESSLFLNKKVSGYSHNMVQSWQLSFLDLITWSPWPPTNTALLSFRIMFLSFNYHPCSEGCIVSTCVRLYVCLCLSVNTITSEPLEIWSQNLQAIILCSKGRTVGQVWKWFFSARQHAERAICYRKSVCPSVSLSVCPSHGWISQKRLNVSSKFFHHLIGPTF